MEVVEVQIPVDDLKLGMYVNRLDRDWVGTPFPFQGFHLTNEAQLRILRQLCKHVFIDEHRQYSPDKKPTGRAAAGSNGATRVDIRGPHQYRNTHSLRDETPSARKANEDALAFAEQMIDDVRNGRKLSEERVAEAVGPIVQSVLRNADAFLWISSLVRRDQYLYSHTVNCAALCAAFGRHLGFSQDALMHLATGGILLDVGMVRIPEEIRAAPRALNRSERELIRSHVEQGRHMIDEAGFSRPEVRDMLIGHHERIDGSGYPAGLEGNDIPLFARLAAVVDAYDAMTSARPWRPALSRHEALQQLYRNIDLRYQAEVVEQFLQCMGTYPTGSLVELSTGEIAIVIEQNQTRRLRPRVLILLDAEKRRLDRMLELDLLTHHEHNPEHPIQIVAAPDPGAYDIDRAALFLN